MKRSSFITLICAFAILLLLGGWMGYKSSHSAASLIAAASFATLLFVSCGGILSKKKWGMPFLWIAMTVITVMFAFRGWVTHKPVPIFLAILSGVLFGVLFFRRPAKKQ